ncbi:MAG TPA: choice-of-anchor D domain-containing protein [Bacteroidales bacterium]|nr:choice-of-anchor D domain-containing protein [Bacteroidales bacterium]HSA43119.1 choice-of-anchor D domain-containing protein [Bacteroidales bacterium]
MKKLFSGLAGLAVLTALAGSVIHAQVPALIYQPANLSTTLNGCSDTSILEIQLQNMGTAPLFFNVSQEIDFTDGFENGLNKWVWTGDWGTTQAQAYEGASSLAESPAGNYPDNQNTYIWLKDSLIITNADSAWLRFQTRYQFECEYDYINIELQVNNNDWIVIGGITCYNNYWNLREYYLGQYLSNGDYIRIRFYFHSDGSGNDEGAYIDNIRITGIGQSVDWAFLPLTAGVIMPGGQENLQVIVHPDGLTTGQWAHHIIILTNDPQHPEVVIPITLDFTGYAFLDFPSSLHDFGEVMEFTTKTDTLVFTNTGCDSLRVDTMYTSSSAFIPLKTGFTLEPGATEAVPVRFEPIEHIPYTCDLFITSNDTSLDPAVPVMMLTGTGTGAPAIAVAPAQLSHTIACGDSVGTQFTVYNTGLSDLNVNLLSYNTLNLILHYPMDGDATDYGPEGLHGTTINTSAATDRQGHLGKALAFNGINSYIDVPDGVFFSGNYTVNAWMNENAYKTWSRLFDFGNGQANDNVLGIASRGTTGIYAAENYYNNISGGQIYASPALPLNQWIMITQVLNGNTYTLYKNGQPYRTANTNQLPKNIIRTSNYIGRSNWSVDGYYSGLLDDFRIYDRALSAQEILDIYGQEVPVWLQFGISQGTIVPGDSMLFTIGLNTGNLQAGIYNTILEIESNDPLHPFLGIPITMEITGNPDMTVSPDSLNFGSTQQYVSVTQNLQINNSGCDTLFIQNMVFSIQDFYCATGIFPDTILPFSIKAYPVSFTPSDSGQYGADLLIESNDGSALIYLSGVASGSPRITFTPDTVIGTIEHCNDSTEVLLLIGNAGSTDLNWQLSAQHDGGKCLGFVSSSHVVTVGNLGAMPEQGTIEFWMRSNQLKNYNNCFSTHGSTGGNRGFRFEENAAGVFGVAVGNDAGSFTGYILTNALSTGTWHHVAVSWDKTTNQLWTYYDGNLINDGVYHSQWATQISNLMIGIGYNTSRWWNGRMDEVRIWSYRRSDRQIKDFRFLMLSGNEVGLLAYWDFNEGSGTVLHDLTPNQFHGTFSGATWYTSEAPLEGFVSVSPDSGVIPPGDNTMVYVKFNGNGKLSGTYLASLIAITNDPLKQAYRYPCRMDVLGEAAIAADTNVLYFGGVIAGAVKQESLIFYNAGCDTLLVDYYELDFGDQYTFFPFPFTVLPEDSAVITVFFNPTFVSVFNDSVTFYSNAGNIDVYLEGTGTEPPVIAVDPGAFWGGAYCDEITEQSLTVYNNGLGTLAIWIPSIGSDNPIMTPASCSPQTISYCCNMGIQRVAFNSLNHPSGNAIEGYQDFTSMFKTTVLPEQTYTLTVVTGPENGENVTAWIDYNNDGSFSSEELIMESTDNFDSIHTAVVEIPAEAVAGIPLRMRVISDYIWEAVPGPCNNPYYGQAEDYTVLIAAGIVLPSVMDTIPPLDSRTYPMYFSGAQLSVGYYYSHIDIYSNDPQTSHISIPTELEVYGDPFPELSEDYHDFGDVIQFTLNFWQTSLTNTGCDTLDIYEAFCSNPAFQVNPVQGTIPPWESMEISVGFSPQDPVYEWGEIVLVTNAGDWIITVEGNGIPAPDLSLDPWQLDLSLECGTTETFTFYIDNFGDGDLNYQINTSSSLSEGLMFYYPFQGDPTDKSGNGRNLENNGAVLTDGHSGLDYNAYRFEYESGMKYENENDFIDNLFNPEASVSLWARFRDTTEWQNEQACLFDMGNTPWDDMGIRIYADKQNVYALVNVEYTDYYLSFPLETEEWTYVTLTFDGFFIRLYKNSGLADEVWVEGTLSYGYYYYMAGLGMRYYNSYEPRYFTGDLDEVRLYNRDLSQEEINTLYHSGSHAIMMNVNPENGNIAPFDWHAIELTIDATEMTGGFYQDVISISSNDPMKPVVWLPVNLEIWGIPYINYSPACLAYDTIMQFTSSVQQITIENPSCTPVLIWNMFCLDASFYPAFSSLVIPAGGSNTVPVIFAPTAQGSLEDTLFIYSEAGLFKICLSGYCIGMPVASVSPSSISQVLACQESIWSSFDLHNTGFADMEYTVGGIASNWFGGISVSGILCAGCSVNIPFELSRTGMPTGLYNTNITISTSDPLNPVLNLPVYLLIPHPLVAVNLGADTGYCAGGSLVLHAGNYVSYLWNEGSTGSGLEVSTPGIYYVDVVDAHQCPSSDTIVITEFAYPVADAGSDTSLCEGTTLHLEGNASGTLPPVPMNIQIGQGTSYSGSTGPSPFGTYYMDHRAQYLYKATEIQQAGLHQGEISAIGFIIGSVGSPGLSNMKIRMMHTALNSLTGFVQGNTEVFDTAYYYPVTGENLFTLQEPFYYDGSSNLLVEVCFDNNGWSSNSTFQYTSVSGGVWARYCDNCAPGCNLTGGSGYSERPNLIITGYGELTRYTWTGPDGFSATIKNPVIQSVTPAASGVYTLDVDNGYGCTDSDEISVAVMPRPVVDAGPDGNILGGEYYTFGSSVSGGAEPYTFGWIPAASLDDSVILQPTANPDFTTVYTFTATGANGCSAQDQATVHVIPRFELSGHVTYNNSMFSAIGNLLVRLNSGGTIVDSTFTDMSGNYLFPYVLEGNYSIGASSDIEPAGINATDALLTGKHVVALETLSGLRLKAADVNNSTTVTGADALLILHHTVGNITTFPAGNWYFEPKSIQIQGSDKVQDFQGILYGDVNASYLPGLKTEASVSLETASCLLATAGSDITLEIKVKEACRPAALTLHLTWPQEYLEFLDLLMPPGQFARRLNSNVLSIAWSNEDPPDLAAGDVLFTIIFRLCAIPPPRGIALTLTGDNEIADASCNPLVPALLTHPLILPPDGSSGFYLGQNIPNPFRLETIIPYLIPEEGNIELAVFNVLGERVLCSREGLRQPGQHELRLTTRQLPPGSYYYRMIFQGATQAGSQVRSMIISK